MSVPGQGKIAFPRLVPLVPLKEARERATAARKTLESEIDTSACERLKTYAEGRAATLAFVNQGADLILNQGFGSALFTTSEAGFQVGSLAAGSGGWSRYNGQRADFDSSVMYWRAHAGLGYQWNLTEKAMLDRHCRRY